MTRIAAVLVILALAHVSRAQQSSLSSGDDDPCHAEGVTDCASCLSVSGSLCAWCKSSELEIRCNLRATYENGSCSEVVDNTSSVKALEDEQTYQVRPREYDVHLRRGDPVNLTVTVTRTKNYPIDLYYLMDFSESNADDLENLKTIQTLLHKRMNELTTNLQTGFGAFVDKPVWPYSNPLLVNNPCFPEKCEKVFTFENVRPLTSSQDDFTAALSETNTSKNIDSPEGLTDALMQAAVCKKQINWRDNAMKFLVIATDNQFHAAGDGRLAGIYKPNDGGCYMDSDGPGGMYTRALEQDYPSLNQIRAALRDSSISLIFAVTAPFIKLYEAFRDELVPVSSFVGRLEPNGSNVVSLIVTGFEDVASRVTLAIDNPSVDTKVFIESCPAPTKEATCTNFSEGSSAEFKVEVTLKECVDKPFELKIEAIPFGVTTVTVNPLCKCDCADDSIENAIDCSEHGTFECGICKCYTGWRPPLCKDACSESTDSCSENQGSLPCSGHGKCECNKCVCNKDEKGRDLWFGDYCQCPTRPCDYGINQQQCGGAGKGSCQCYQNNCTCECACQPGWKNIAEDRACDCSTDTADCESADGQLCAGRGTCECGTCVCPLAWDDGGRCEDCNQKICPFLCSRGNISDCVRCKIPGAVGGRNYSEEECNSNVTCPYNIKLIPSPDSVEDYKIEEDGVTYDTTVDCAIVDDETCSHAFFVAVTNDNELVNVHLIQKEDRNCPKDVGSVPIIPIVIGIIAGIVGIGLLLLLLWWLLAKLRDYQEYKEFQREMANAAWNQTTSPLYEPPNKKYNNPMYKKKAA